MLSATTLIVLLANGLTAIVAAALLMLVLWQAPRRRMNQYFALAMIILLLYSFANSLGRFIDRFGLDATTTTYAAIALLGLFAVAIFFFASEFAQDDSSLARAMRGFGLVMAVVNNLALWSHHLIVDIRPAGSGDGSYTGTWTALGLVMIGIMHAYLLVTVFMLRRASHERGRALWRGPALVILATTSSALIWPIVHIPLQAIGLALAAIALGLPVLRHELFNPLAELHEELLRKNAELRRASAMKNEFLANMSHELRTPLNSVIGYSELVLNGTYGALNDTQRDRLQKVIRNGYNLLGLINDVLDLNRIESGRITLQQQPVDIGSVLDQVLETVEPLARQKGLAIQRDYHRVPSVLGDRQRLVQIMTNILGNAVKFTHAGHIAVRAQVDTGSVHIAISDTGIGIPPDQIERVFVEFEQLDSSPTREYEGTGLGMAITKRLVELHQGAISIDSVPGEGTTVHVLLPASGHTVPTAAPALAERD